MLQAALLRVPVGSVTPHEAVLGAATPRKAVLEAQPLARLCWKLEMLLGRACMAASSPELAPCNAQGLVSPHRAVSLHAALLR